MTDEDIPPLLWNTNRESSPMDDHESGALEPRTPPSTLSNVVSAFGAVLENLSGISHQAESVDTAVERETARTVQSAHPQPSVSSGNINTTGRQSQSGGTQIKGSDPGKIGNRRNQGDNVKNLRLVYEQQIKKK